MRRVRFWIAVGSAVLVVLLLALVIALPYVVRRVTVSQLTSLTGRQVAIQEIGLNLFTRRLSVVAFNLADRGGSAPFVEFARIDARFRILPLLRGALYLDEFALATPHVRIVRLPSGDFNFTDILARLASGEKKPSQEPAKLTLARFALTAGGITFEDRTVSPPRTFTLAGLGIELKDISTVTDAARGTASLDCTLAGAPVTMRAEGIRGHPAKAKAVVTVDKLDLAQLWPYVPPDAAIRPGGGRFTTRLELDYDAAAGARAGGDVTITDLALIKKDQTEPLVTTPELRMTSRDIVYRDGVVTAGRLELKGDPSILDATLTPARRYDLTGVHLKVEDVSYPTRGPGRLSLVAGLPSGGGLEVNGTTTLAPVTANLDVTLKAIDLALGAPYVPPVSPVTLDRGRLDGGLTVGLAEDSSIRVNGELVTSNLILLRKGQSQPFVTHRKLVTKITDLGLKDGAITLARLAVSGAPSILDASVSPPQRVDFTSLSMIAEDASWPARGPARVNVQMAIAGSGNGTIRGTFHPGTLAADIRAILADVDLARFAPYLPPDAPVTLARGRLATNLAFKHDQKAGIRLGGDGTVTDLAVSRRGEREPLLVEPRLTFAIADLTAKVETLAVAVRTLSIAGAPTVTDTSVSPSRSLSLRGFKLSVADARYPGDHLAKIGLDVDLPEAGTVRVAGRAAPSSRTLDLKVDMVDASLAPYRPFVPISGPIGGRASAALTVAVALADGLQIGVKGKAEAQNITVGPTERAPITVANVMATGIDVRWPERVRIERVGIVKPSGIVERAQDGSFPLRAVLAPPGTGDATGSPPATLAAPPAPSTTPAPPAAAGPRLAVEIGEVVVEEGNIRFLDQSTTPSYSEEISRLALTVRGITTAATGRADLAMQAVVGATSALDLKGQIAPLADPFFLELDGELREFPLPRANPYFRQFFDWFLKRGSVTTKVHYRITGDKLEATNRIKVERLGVEKEQPAAGADKKIGLPLGMIVAVLTDSRGSIEFDVPVEGHLGSPQFSLGSAVMAALKNVLVNLVTSPFKAMGRLFGGGGETMEELKVDPVTFDVGSSGINPEADQHLQRVADFLRGSPNIRLTLRPVVTPGDVASLKLAEVTARIQRVQREEKLPDFAAAAARVFKQVFPDKALPKTSDEMVEALRERETLPDTAARQLAERRVEVTRQALVERAGVQPERLQASETPPEGGGKGRVEFELSG